MIYFVLAPQSKRVKVGFSKNVRERIKQLQTGAPETLVVYGTMRGAMSAEKKLHDILAAYRLAGEWFDAAGEVLQFLELCNHTDDLEKAHAAAAHLLKNQSPEPRKSPKSNKQISATRRIKECLKNHNACTAGFGYVGFIRGLKYSGLVQNNSDKKVIAEIGEKDPKEFMAIIEEARRSFFCLRQKEAIE